ncbi:hypothetical protein N9406_00615 [Verrucomicrobiales bacterium]|nr:hypothetical protein [Verrucomicrobiales bacterium]
MKEPKQSLLTELRMASLAGIRANLMPGIGLWIFGLAIVLTFYFVDSARPVFDWAMAVKQRHGFLYSGLATAVFAGVIPFLYLLATGKFPRGTVLATALFYILFWSYRGIEVDAFYRFQAWLFGGDTEWATIVKKVLFDQFIYCMIWAAPMTAACYAWRDVGYSFRKLKGRFNRRFFLFEIPNILLSTWVIWIPATAIIYSLPLPLQIPLFNLVLCFFVLLVAVLTARKE